MKTRTELFTGYKGVRLEDLPEEAWRIIAGDGGGNQKAELYGAVAWLYRAVDIRAGAVANMPFAVMRGETEVMTQDTAPPEQFAWLESLPDLLYRTEAAVTLCGKAYWFRERNLMRTLDVRWLNPNSINPVIDESGLRGFRRRLRNTEIPLEVDDLVYFWPPDWTVELGPAANYPGKAAMSAAGVLHSLDEFLTVYFERGMIKATLISYAEPPVAGMKSNFTVGMDDPERNRLQEWWRRVMSGVKNSNTTELVKGEVKPVVIGEGLHDLQNTALTAEQREAVCTALGVPQSKLTANAANFATKQSDDLSFIQDTIAPECRWLAAAINKQLLGPMGLRLEFRPDELSIMQEDEEQRAGSLKTLVDAGISLEMALEILGYDLPDGIELREKVNATPPQLLPFVAATTTGQLQPVGQPPPDNDERIEETRRFLRWAKRRAHPDPEQYESVILSHDDKIALLEDANGDDAPFRHNHESGGEVPGWDNYP